LRFEEYWWDVESLPSLSGRWICFFSAAIETPWKYSVCNVERTALARIESQDFQESWEIETRTNSGRRFLLSTPHPLLLSEDGTSKNGVAVGLFQIIGEVITDIADLSYLQRQIVP
jgi:hypothetical protein